MEEMTAPDASGVAIFTLVIANYYCFDFVTVNFITI